MNTDYSLTLKKWKTRKNTQLLRRKNLNNVKEENKEYHHKDFFFK